MLLSAAMRHQSLWVGSAYVLLALAGCSVELTIPSDAMVECAQAGECPIGFRCSLAIGRCVPGDQNVRPTLSTGAVPRGVAQVSVPAVVTDDDGDEVLISAQVSTDGISFSDVSVTPAAVQAEGSGTNVDLVWDAASFFGGTGYQPSVILRLLPSDSGGNGSGSDTEAFEYGNDVPTLTVTPATRTALAVPVSGDIIVEYIVTDTSSDVAELQLQFREDDAAPWQDAALSFGRTDGLVTSPLGETHIAVWDSLSSTGGIGSQSLDAVDIRLLIGDDPAGEGLVQSPEVTIDDIQIRNASVPQVFGVVARPSGANAGISPIEVSYVITDAENDLVDVLVEYSFDTGVNWLPCEEYPVPASEGTEDLAATSGTGTTHLFFWDPSGTVLTVTDALVRITAADDTGVGNPVQTTVTLGQDKGGTLFAAPVDVTYSTTDPPVSFETGDFNGDDITDIAIVSKRTSNAFDRLIVEIMLGQGTAGVGDGTFVNTQSYPMGDSRPPNNRGHILAVGDFDGDLLEDIAVAKADVSTTGGPGDAVAILWGNGDGTFEAPVEHPAVGHMRMLYAGHFNNDTTSDLVLTLNPDAEFWISNGDRTFSITDRETAVSDGITMAVIDLDLDGDVDVVTPRDFGVFKSVSVLLNNGDATFENNQTLTPPSPVGVSAALLDNDPYPDLIVSNFSQGNVTVLRADESNPGTFLPQAEYATGPGERPVATGDINGDGAIDAIDGRRDAILLSQLSGGVPAGRFARVEAVGLDLGAPNDLLLHDFNEDGLLDIALARDNASLRVILQVPEVVTVDENDFSASLTVALPAADPWDLAVADFDADGVRDIALAGGGTITIASGASSLFGGPFTSTRTFPSVSSGGTVAPFGAIEAADFNQDGAVDLVVHDASDDLGIWFGQSSNGVPNGDFLYDSSVALPTRAQDLLSVDTNNDGMLDIVGVSETGSPDKLHVYVASSPGAFLPRWGIDVSSGRSVAAADFNGDGNVDLAVGNNTNMQTLLGAGDGTFTLQATFTETSSTQRSVTARDLDGDGIVDIMSFGNTTEVFLGSGDGNFVHAPLLGVSASGTAQESTLGDFTADGVLDILDTGTTFGISRVFSGQQMAGVGTGAFDAPFSMVTPDATQFSRVRPLDINRDGLLDVVTSDFLSATLVARLGERNRLKFVLRRPLSGTINGDAVAAIGVSPATTVNRFGNAPAPLSVSIERARQTEHDSLDRQLSSLVAPTERLRVLSDPWLVSGDIRITRVPRPGLDVAGPRLRVHNRLGAVTGTGTDGSQVREGLDLSASPPRGIAFDLPLLAGRDDTQIDAAAVRVFARIRDWTRADAVPGDSLSTAAEAGDFLPRVADAEGFRDGILLTESWVEIPMQAGTDLSVGAGPRFVLIRQGTDRRVRILTDKLGTFQAFLTDP